MLTYGAIAKAQVFTETFGNSPTRVSNLYVPSGNFAFAGSGSVSDGSYTVMRPQGITTSTGDNYWTNLTSDHTGDNGGALMVLNAGPELREVYLRDFNVQPGTSYEISAWRYVVNGNGGAGSTNPVSWSLQMRNPANNSTLAQSGPLASTPTQAWVKSTYQFTVPADCQTTGVGVPARLALTNQTAAINGNDYYIDDISVSVIATNNALDQYCPAPANPVPTLGQWALMLLSMTLAGFAALRLRGSRRY